MTDIVHKLHKLIEAKDKHIAELIQENCALIRRDPNDDLIERQAARIAELEASINYKDGCAKQFIEETDAYVTKTDARIAALEATIEEYSIVEAKQKAALNYFLERDTDYSWRYKREEAESKARAAMEGKDD